MLLYYSNRRLTASCQENKVILAIAAVLRHLTRTHDKQCGVLRGFNLVNVQKKREGQDAGARPIDHPQSSASVRILLFSLISSSPPAELLTILGLNPIELHIRLK